MKYSVFVMLCLFIMGAGSCSKDKQDAQNIDEPSVKPSIVARPYRVSYFYEGGVVRTDDFASVTLTFTPAGTIAGATSLATYNGTWSTSTVPNFTVVNINFASPVTFQRLSKAWQVYTNVDGRINMQSKSTSGVIDQLIIEQ